MSIHSEIVVLTCYYQAISKLILKLFVCPVNFFVVYYDHLIMKSEVILIATLIAMLSLNLPVHASNTGKLPEKLKKTKNSNSRQIAGVTSSILPTTTKTSNIYLVNKNDIQLGSLDELRTTMDKRINETYLRLGQ